MWEAPFERLAGQRVGGHGRAHRRRRGHPRRAAGVEPVEAPDIESALRTQPPAR